MTKSAKRFSFTKEYNENLTVSCEEDIDIPLSQPLRWLTSRLLQTHKIPVFAEKDFSECLKAFVEQEERVHIDAQVGSLYDLLGDGSQIDDLIGKLESRVQEVMLNAY